MKARANPSTARVMKAGALTTCGLQRNETLGLLRVAERGSHVHFLQRFLVLAEQGFDAVEFLLYSRAVVCVRGKVEQNGRHGFSVDRESFVPDVFEIVAIHLISVVRRCRSLGAQ